MELSIGEVYYQLTYPGVGLLYPKIDTFVFVGKNIAEEDTEDTWYFQFVESYARYGSVLDTGKGDRKVMGLTKAELAEIFDIKTLASKLEEAAARRRMFKRGNA
jgi:hypothetical protein